MHRASRKLFAQKAPRIGDGFSFLSLRIEPVEDKGTLVILTPERFTASNPEHVALAARVHELLDQAGLLRPVQPWPAS